MKFESSEKKIITLCTFFDDHVYNKNIAKFDSFLVVCDKISGDDVLFKNYIKLYSSVKSIIVITEDDWFKRQDEMLNIWNQSLEYYQSIKDEYFTTICLAYIGYIYYMKKDYANSIETFLKTERNFRNIGFDKFPDIGKHLHNMSLVFYFFRQYEKVIQLMEISIKYNPFSDNLHIQRHNTLAAAYLKAKKYNQAEKAYAKTLAISITYQNPIWTAIATKGLAKVNLHLQHYQKAYDLYKSKWNTMRDVYVNSNNLYSREYSEYLLEMAKSCIFLNQLNKAKYFLDSLPYTKTSNTKEQMFMFGVSYQDINYWIDYYDVWGKYYLAIKNHEKSHYYADSLYQLKYQADSVFNGLEVQTAMNRIEIQEKKYQNEAIQITINKQNQLLVWISLILIIIVIGSLILWKKNKKIHSQNNIITEQLTAMQKVLEQKKILLSELQHRVKNNLQHVVSILEIQKESIAFTSMEELVKANQNRIHSMALLHKKLNTTDNINEVNLKTYLDELTILVKNSYHCEAKEIQLIVHCTVEKLSLEKALPIGLIIVELVSNSMKHAFNNQNSGFIHIEILNADDKNLIHYYDNGCGFNFHQENKTGLGVEIIKGLIDQIDGEIETQNTNGFDLKIYFEI